MFERYTEKARRVIFFARYEASQFGSPTIESEHLLLGLLREDKALTNRFLHAHSSVEEIRKQIESRTIVRESISTSVDLPLSDENKRVLSSAAEEAERLGHQHIGTEHLLIGLLREKQSFAAQILAERGLTAEAVRGDLARAPHLPPPTPAQAAVAQAPIAVDLTEAVTQGHIDPVIGRDREIEATVHILASRCRNNPILVGEPGAGKTAIVQALAQRLSSADPVPSLAGRRILSLDPLILVQWSASGHRSGELIAILMAQASSSRAIVFVDDLHLLVRSGQPSAAAVALQHVLLHQDMQCIATSTNAGYAIMAQEFPALAGILRTVFVRPLDETQTLTVLESRKGSLEKFHHVTFSEDALQLAATSAARTLPSVALPGAALELLDAAGALAKLRRARPPAEVAEAEARVRHI